MTDKVKRLLTDLKGRQYRHLRLQVEQMSFDNVQTPEGQIYWLGKLVEIEKPLIYTDDAFGFNRYGAQKVKRISGNVTPNYGRILQFGFQKSFRDMDAAMNATRDPEKLAFGQVMKQCLEISLQMVERYRESAREQGNTQLYEALCRVPMKGARTYYEALVSMKCMLYLLRLNFCEHVTLGRFDQYMYPYFKADLERGVSRERLLELTEEFFISLNRDVDVFTGIQVGDNGQSMVLGGFAPDGTDQYNELSQVCMEAALELKLIDPKINLRVGKNTPLERYIFATHLTKAGLGFPQYCNDDVAVPGLIKLGYAPEDAWDYTVAACWEFIAPNCGADVPNIISMDFPKQVNQAIHEHLMECESFDVLLEKVKENLARRCDEMVEKASGITLPVQPFQSIFIDGCIESLTSMWQGGAKYHNFGAHGIGISIAADALAAVKKQVYEDRTITPEELLAALDANFEGTPQLRKLLLESPKMGNNDPYVDELAGILMDTYAENFNGRSNSQHGIFRAGTGSAMHYVSRARECPATADGRLDGNGYPCSFSPGLDAKPQGLLSVIQSFTSHDMTSIINGGPLTLELHDTVFRNDLGIQKVAQLVKIYIDLGGHQLQLNAVNRARLLDAKAHPENYPDLIVRVWGWSGYWRELDTKYQDHILRRMEYSGN